MLMLLVAQQRRLAHPILVRNGPQRGSQDKGRVEIAVGRVAADGTDLRHVFLLQTPEKAL
jgi:hypothetical protein